MASRIPGATFVLVEDAGHLPHLENPAALDQFLEPC
ncbi:alpha/beta fold hydrolase [Cellulomonas sp. ICMP 17802]